MIEPVVIKWPSGSVYYHDILDLENGELSEVSSDDFVDNPKLETKMLSLTEVSTYGSIWRDVLAGIVLSTNEKVSDYIGRYRPELLL